MSFLNDILKGLLILGIIGMGSDLLDLRKLSSKAIKVYKKESLSYRSWNDMLHKNK